jgi:hypothetical protein
MRSFTVSSNHQVEIPTTVELEPLCHIITPIGMLSYGFDEGQTSRALDELQSSPVPVALILDSGSTDSSLAKLATGVTKALRSSYERDIRNLWH